MVDEAVLDSVAEDGYDPAYGARPLRRVVQQRIENELAKELLKGEYVDGDTIHISLGEGEFAFTRQEMQSA